jgi:hypothetical protein
MRWAWDGHIVTVWYNMLMFANMQTKSNKTKHEHLPIKNKAIKSNGKLLH